MDIHSTLLRIQYIHTASSWLIFRGCSLAKVFDVNKIEKQFTKEENPVDEPPSVIESKATEKPKGLKTSVGTAYLTYLSSRKNLAMAFKEREYRDEQAYQEAERQYRLCALAIDQAMKNRENAEHEAAELYTEDLDQAINKASQAYKSKTKQAMSECKQKVMDAWKNSMETAENTSVVCEESIEKAMQTREKIEIEALVNYRQEVDKAVDNASYVYKDRLTKALFESKQKVMDAWDNSMGTSTQMTGVFEEDKTIDSMKTHPNYSKPESQKSDVNNSLLRIKANVISTFHKVRKELVEKHAEE